MNKMAKCKKGYRNIEGKCAKKRLFSNFRKNQKRSYNPFKMIGSYIGAVSLYLSALIFGLSYFNFFYVTLWQTVLHFPPVSYSVIILTLILGFLIGWVIQILIRRLRK